MSAAKPEGAGALLAAWRTRRQLSQLELSLRSGVSSKHISFIETGRSQPSRTMLLDLCTALGVPPRRQNDILLAGGYAPAFQETPIESEALEEATEALGLILRSMEPFGAVVFDRRWDIVMANQAYLDWAGDLSSAYGSYQVLQAPRPNVIDLLFSENAYRPLIVNWAEAAETVLRHVRAEFASRPDEHLRNLLERHAPSLPRARSRQPPRPVLPVELRIDGAPVRLLYTISTLGSASDITLRELRIKMFHPADAEARARVESWDARRRAVRQTPFG